MLPRRPAYSTASWRERGGIVLRTLAAPVDIRALAMFRILFGLLMATAMIRFLAKGWIQTNYLDPTFHFPWVSWIRPWPGIGMHLHVWALAMLALFIAAGLFYRFSAVLFFLGFTYLEFIDRTTYLNHYYLVTLLSGLLVFLPAHRRWSIDARMNPALGSSTAPAWTLYILRFQLVVVYFFAGLAKLNWDWLFAAQPLRTWLMAKSDLPLIGPSLAEPATAFAASWAGALYDLSIPFLLLSSRTRPVAYGLVVVFHVATAVLFPIGMFPWVMIVATLVFFPPSWPGSVMDLWKARSQNAATSAAESAERAGELYPSISRACAGILCGYCILQVALPLRSWCYPHQGAWDGRGFHFAWRVMLVEKSGHVEMHACHAATGLREQIPMDRYITPRQRMIMAQEPMLIRLLAQHLASEYGADWEIRVDAYATLNGRRSQRLVRGDINLAGSLPSDWIVPLGTTSTRERADSFKVSQKSATRPANEDCNL